ncbi:ATP-binding protein [uncultured Hoeflea sp.]|uniref:sensor histidine kinase n=1 Tax=uncultured Hoeflea sp. TaxID=538666 RepID=UPI00262CE282|nr:ATP-binding protein [uncultured Hoeflea sp.]
MRQTANQKVYPIVGAARRSVAVILVSITALAIGLLFVVSQTYFKSLDREAAETRLLLYKRSLDDTLKRYQYFPFVLAQDPLTKETLNGAANRSLNLRLERFARESELEAIYLMDVEGLVLASSNFKKPHSFVGQNYGFRPYFKHAIDGRRGNYFGIGATTGRPGYFVSAPVMDGDAKVIGVIAIKLDVSELQQTWEDGDEQVLASNADGIVVLASNRDWLFGTLNDLTPAQLVAIKESKQFGDMTMERLPWQKTGAASVRFGDNSYIYSEAAADYLNWNVHYLLSEGRAYERALFATIVFGSAISLLVGFAAYLRSKRIQAALAISQSDRDQLREANKQLEQAHSELARSSKLAALGQLSASVVHELGQPISALRNYLTAEEIASNGPPHPIQQKLNGVVDRMESITKQLRFFIKPGDEKMERVVLNDVILSALELMQHDFTMAGLEVICDLEPGVTVMGNRLRLEQVLINLLNNALYSLNEGANKGLSISLSRSNGVAVISVADEGVGFGDRGLSQLQEPFHTTRASGDGMGLGLSIAASIVKEHNGELRAENRPKGGAVFSIRLPVAEKVFEEMA